MESLVNFKYAPSTQEVVFAEILARTQDPEQAWLDAGYESLSSSKNIKKALALAKTNKIQERLEYHKALLIQKANLSDSEVISEMKDIAMSNMADYVTEDNEFKSFDSLSRSQMAAVKKIKITQTEYGVVHEVTLYDKTQALDKLFKMLNLFERHTQANAPKITLNLNNVNQQVVES
jgi:predicted MarR family transcription regulator